MKKFTAFFLGAVILMQSVCPFGFTATAESNSSTSSDRVIQLEQADYNDELITLNLLRAKLYSSISSLIPKFMISNIFSVSAAKKLSFHIPAS